MAKEISQEIVVILTEIELCRNEIKRYADRIVELQKNIGELK